MGNCGGSEEPKKQTTTKQTTTKQTTEKKTREATPNAPASRQEQEAVAEKCEAIEEKIEEDAAKKGGASGPAEILMISGCRDDQTSADVSDVAAILKEKSEKAVKVTGAGGACTSSLLHVTSEEGLGLNWRELLQKMQGFLASKDYKQVPQLSSSWKHGMADQFSITGDQKGNKYAMLTGINYQGTGAQLDGCTNDVKRMIGHLTDHHGFEATSSNMKIFIDPTEAVDGVDVEPQAPTKENLLGGIEWIIRTVQPGDVVFFHYSGHGTQVPDEDGSEEDGKDEALVPLDYASAKFITDDDIFNYLVSKMPAGSRLFALMDCCHSGTIFDLPYTIKADEKLSDADAVVENHAAHQKLVAKTEKKAARKSRAAR